MFVTILQCFVSLYFVPTLTRDYIYLKFYVSASLLLYSEKFDISKKARKRDFWLFFSDTGKLFVGYVVSQIQGAHSIKQSTKWIKYSVLSVVDTIYKLLESQMIHAHKPFPWKCLTK